MKRINVGSKVLRVKNVFLTTLDNFRGVCLQRFPVWNVNKDIHRIERLEIQKIMAHHVLPMLCMRKV